MLIHLRISEIKNKSYTISVFFSHLIFNLREEIDMKEHADVFDTDSFIDRCVRELELNPVVGEEAKEIMKRAADTGISSGPNPIGQVSAAVYVASILTANRITQRSVAEFAGVSEATIRKRYVELAKGLGYYSK
jgi:transcription initiation factor TFIIIB Brf1 subunit/transcription initiation factor TFIIB